MSAEVDLIDLIVLHDGWGTIEILPDRAGRWVILSLDWL
jgi:hypothetical protein